MEQIDRFFDVEENGHRKIIDRKDGRKIIVFLTEDSKYDRELAKLMLPIISDYYEAKKDEE